MSFLLNVINKLFYAECRYAQCHSALRRYAECLYSQCRGALQTIDTLGSELLNFMFNWCHDITPKDNQQTNNPPLQLPSLTVNVCSQADTVFDDKGSGGSGPIPRSSFWPVLNKLFLDQF